MQEQLQAADQLAKALSEAQSLADHIDKGQLNPAHINWRHAADAWQLALAAWDAAKPLQDGANPS
jgi:hypothetical protein